MKVTNEVSGVYQNKAKNADILPKSLKRKKKGKKKIFQQTPEKYKQFPYTLKTHT